MHGEETGFFVRDRRHPERMRGLVAHAAHRRPQYGILGAHGFELRVFDALAARHAQQHGAQVRAQVGAEGGKPGQLHTGLALHAADQQGGELADAQLLRVVPVLLAQGGVQIMVEIGGLARGQAHAQRALERDLQRGGVAPGFAARAVGFQTAAAHLPREQGQMQHERDKCAVAEHKPAAALEPLQHTGDRLHVFPVEQAERRAVLPALGELFPVHLGQLRAQADAHGAAQVFRRAVQPDAHARAPFDRYPAREQPFACRIEVVCERVLGNIQLFRQPLRFDRLARRKQQGEQAVDALVFG